MTDRRPQVKATAASSASSFDEALGARLRAVREARGLSYAALASRTAIPPSRLASLESGAQPMTAATLMALTRALGTEVATLLDGVRDVAAVRDHPLQPILREAHGALHEWRTLQQALEEHFGPASIAASARRRSTRNRRTPDSGASPPPSSRPW